MSKMDEIKSCACGKYEIYQHYIRGSANVKHWIIRCKNCNLFVETKKKEKAIAIWNSKIDKANNAMYKEGIHDAEIDFQNSEYWNDYLAKVISDANAEAVAEYKDNIKKWCKTQASILEKQSEVFHSDECYGGYRAFTDMIHYLEKGN